MTINPISRRLCRRLFLARRSLRMESGDSCSVSDVRGNALPKSAFGSDRNSARASDPSRCGRGRIFSIARLNDVDMR